MRFDLNKSKYFEKIFSLTQAQLHKVVQEKLHNYYNKHRIKVTKDYIYAIGDIPVALVAHLDTVWEENPPKFTFFDPFKNVMWSPNGLGADDRAGVLGILEILEAGLRPHVIFTTDEEIGGFGAEALAYKRCPFKNLRYIIELDRRGNNDCVFYDCESKKFQNYIESFGFKTAIGSFSDISILCGAWKICGVNLSIGYYNEHTEREILFLNSMYNTIARVIKMLKIKNIPEFEWEGISYFSQLSECWLDYYKKVPPMKVACKNCHKTLVDQEAVGALNHSGGIAYYCFDCMPKKVSYCPVCNRPFENSEGIQSDKLCDDCSLKYKGYNDEGFDF